MKNNLKEVIKNIESSKLGVTSIKFDFFKKLGIGEGNLNYIFSIEKKKFICRINIDNGVPNKSKEEYQALKMVESLNIAPKVFYLHQADEHYLKDFIIIEFIEGKPLRMKKRSYTTEQVKKLAIILAELHRQKNDKLVKTDYSYQYYLEGGLNYIRSINKYTNKKFDFELKQIHQKIEEFVPKKELHQFGIIHGDVCPQNIVEIKNDLKLIDWESLKYSDPAKDVSNVLIDLGLKDRLLDVFLREYHKKRKDNYILDRAKIYAVLMRYHYFLWEIVRAFEIIHQKMPKEYLRKTSAQRHINEAKHQFKKLKQLIDVPEMDLNSFFMFVKN